MSVIAHPAPLWRRLAALVYDALLLVALLMVAAALSTLVANLLLPGLQEREPDYLSHHPLHQLWLLACWFGYYAFSWRKSGQTVGMKAWHIRVIDRQRGPVSWLQCLKRFIGALLGAGFLLVPFHRERYSLQDLVSNTEVIHIPKITETPKKPEAKTKA